MKNVKIISEIAFICNANNKNEVLKNGKEFFADFNITKREIMNTDTDKVNAYIEQMNKDFMKMSTNDFRNKYLGNRKSEKEEIKMRNAMDYLFSSGTISF